MTTLPLSNSNQPLSYAGLFSPETVDQGLREHVASAAQLPPGAAIEKFLKLVVFAPYVVGGAQQWKQAIPVIAQPTYEQQVATHIVRAQTDYMVAAEKKPVDPNDFTAVATAFELVTANFAQCAIAPIAKIVAHNYLALALNRIAGLSDPKSEARTIALTQADNSLATCIAAERQFGDEAFPLWSGYALFNQARVKHQLGQDWLPIMEAAIEAREKSAASDILLPQVVRAGLTVEVHYARLTLANMMPDHPKAADYCAAYDAWKCTLPENGLHMATENLRKTVVASRPAAKTMAPGGGVDDPAVK